MVDPRCLIVPGVALFFILIHDVLFLFEIVKTAFFHSLAHGGHKGIWRALTFVAHTIPEAIDIASSHLNGANEIMVIGGGVIYSEFMPYATRIYLTEIEQAFEGSVLFPEIDLNIWEEVARTAHPADERNAYPYQFVTYEKINSNF